ncbi:MAG TPA: hypothetical protein VML94_08380 [Thermoplasmata archaeon]|nr:hypothetical protein [Thermoplasmata archaeon]
MPNTAPSSPPAPYAAPASMANEWKARGGLVKMIGFVIEGAGILVSGASVHYFLDLINGNGLNTQSLYNSLFNTLEAGVMIAGVGVIVIGIGLYLESRQA